VDLDDKDHLSFDEWKRVLAQLKAAGTIYLLITGGEAMVRADFLDIARYARRNGFFISLLTNCSLITPEIARALAELKPVYLATSLYGATATTHESVTQVPGSFQKTVEGIELLVGAGVTPTIQTTIMKTNSGELPQMKELVESLNAYIQMDMRMLPSKTGADFPFQYEAGIEELAGCDWQPDIPSQNEDIGPQMCKAGRSICSISPNGDVFPCITFPLKLGNLRQTSFDSIWSLKPCAELRYLRSMRHSSFYACNKCEIRAYCQRCTGVAYMESGSMDGPSPSACRQAQTRWRLNHAAEVEPCQKNFT
jgi:radical SAM protein with 4Fe4S-binding SPASM domain